jgi:Fe2+ or Zn2+ uptake regulation protein
MDLLNLTAEEQAVLMAVQNEHLTSFQILKKVKNISMILSLYTILEDLNKKGILKSYMKQDEKYHYDA